MIQNLQHRQELHTEISTERLVLRHFRYADAARVRELCNNPNVSRMVSRLPHPYPEGLAEAWIATHDDARAAGSAYPFAIERDGLLIGSIGLQRMREEMELGYWLGEPWWGRGYATEAARALTAFARDELGLERLIAGHFSDNPASGRVLDKCGFRYTGEERRWCEAREQTVSCRTMALKLTEPATA